jgi:8-oxo-dGTP pyrophosphatase MutT (NUDIX family)
MRADEAIVVVRRDDEFLALLRRPSDGGYWHLVSGSVEAGETPPQAAARELEEETGLLAAVLDLEWSFTYVPLTETPRPPVRVESFLAEAPSGWEPELNAEHDEYRWCAAVDAEALLRWPEPRELVRRVACGS